MAYVNLNIPEQLLTKATNLAKAFKVNRSVYLRNAIDDYVKKTERELLARQLKSASGKCRDESLAVCREFENIDEVPG
jgi:metal-responsive CopG/Arc/MetJ family transcriptional regulator